MSRFSLECPDCGATLELAPRRLLVRVDAGSARSGELLFTCLACSQTVIVPVDPAGVAALVGGGVTFLSLSEPPREHPENPPAGPRLTADDVLDLHTVLERPDWFELLQHATAARGPVDTPRT